MAVGNVKDLTNPMPSYNGLAAGINQNGQLANLAWVPRVVTKTAAYTVKAEESGTIFNTTGATAAVNFTLPAAGDGPWAFFFFNGADVNMTVTAETAGTMVTYNDLTADAVAFSTSSEKIGGGFFVYCDGTDVHAGALVTDPRYQTVSVTSA